MKKRMIFLVAALFFFSIVGSVYAATHELKRLGVSPLYKAKNLKAGDIYPIFLKIQKEVKEGFIRAGALAVYFPFMEQLKSAKIKAIQVKPGETLKWMIFKKRKRVRVLQDVKWAGKDPFKAYQYIVRYKNKIYEFIIPVICFNIALKNVSEVPAPPARMAPPPPPNKDPICSLTVSPVEVLTGEMITLDASNSSDPDGKIVSARFVITNSQGKVVEEKVVAAPPFIYKTKLSKGDIYKVQALVKDDKGKEATSQKCSLAVKVLKRGFFIADAGVLKQWDPATFVVARVGYLYKFTKQIGLMGLLGGAPVVSESDNDEEDEDEDSAFVGDLMLSIYPAERFFINVGAGVWSMEHKTRGDIILSTGVHLTNKFNGPNLLFFIEGRSATDEFDDISSLGRFGAGFRLLF